MVIKKHVEGTIRVGGRVSSEKNKEIDALAKELSMSKTSLMSLIIHLGFGALLRAVKPESIMDWTKITAAFEEAGVGLEKVIEEESSKK